MREFIDRVLFPSVCIIAALIVGFIAGDEFGRHRATVSAWQRVEREASGMLVVDWEPVKLKIDKDGFVIRGDVSGRSITIDGTDYMVNRIPDADSDYVFTRQKPEMAVIAK